MKETMLYSQYIANFLTTHIDHNYQFALNTYVRTCSVMCTEHSSLQKSYVATIFRLLYFDTTPVFVFLEKTAHMTVCISYTNVGHGPLVLRLGVCM